MHMDAAPSNLLTLKTDHRKDCDHHDSPHFERGF